MLEPNHTGLFYPWLLENKKISSEVKDNRLIYGNLEEAFIKLEE